ncbi:unnamed protein product [Lactuca virosa]|uniref:Uncharacterized protein n=1 Tax=Lactuca virosa TaxID=75947 RepID=A0AAU9MTW0_9ASTR|nr:unnamed protein product [Lactuca virosa]
MIAPSLPPIFRPLSPSSLSALYWLPPPMELAFPRDEEHQDLNVVRIKVIVDNNADEDFITNDLPHGSWLLRDYPLVYLLTHSSYNVLLNLVVHWFRVVNVNYCSEGEIEKESFKCVPVEEGNTSSTSEIDHSFKEEIK